MPVKMLLLMYLFVNSIHLVYSGYNNENCFSIRIAVSARTYSGPIPTEPYLALSLGLVDNVDNLEIPIEFEKFLCVRTAILRGYVSCLHKPLINQVLFHPDYNNANDLITLRRKVWEPDIIMNVQYMIITSLDIIGADDVGPKYSYVFDVRDTQKIYENQLIWNIMLEYRFQKMNFQQQKHIGLSQPVRAFEIVFDFVGQNISMDHSFFIGSTFLTVKGKAGSASWRYWPDYQVQDWIEIHWDQNEMKHEKTSRAVGYLMAQDIMAVELINIEWFMISKRCNNSKYWFSEKGMGLNFTVSIGSIGEKKMVTCAPKNKYDQTKDVYKKQKDTLLRMYNMLDIQRMCPYYVCDANNTPDDTLKELPEELSYCMK